MLWILLLNTHWRAAAQRCEENGESEIYLQIKKKEKLSLDHKQKFMWNVDKSLMHIKRKED